MRDPQLSSDSATTRTTSLDLRLPELNFDSLLQPPHDPRRGTSSASAFSSTPHPSSANHYVPLSQRQPYVATPASVRAHQISRAWEAGPPPATVTSNTPHIQLAPRLAPYQQPAQQELPPPSKPAPVHRVYILNCSRCQMFLTDRGMRAVLLLKPNIILFSTDAAPCNASPAFPDEPSSTEPVAERTCECLTSSLACHGCGTTVGYHIVQPCARCTSSVQKHQRSANHHRYVFHHNEVVSRERQYYPSEAGVLTPHPPTHLPVQSPVSPSSSTRRAREHQKGVEVDTRIRSRQRTTLSPLPPKRVNPGLRVGDTIYWHNLTPGGERSRPIDPDTRRPRALERFGR